jgi:hypothetical protein
MNAVEPWWAEGLLFENCNCQVICPAHVSFRQNCTHERCLGQWAIHFADGRYGETPLGGVNAVVLYDSPRQMYAGDWTQAIYVDDAARSDQRRAAEAILTGEAGGPWAVLARFVGKRLETRSVSVVLEDEGRVKRVRVDGVLECTIEALRGKDREKEVLLENMFNQIHAPTQVLASGNSRVEDRGFSFRTEGTHALYSRFVWDGP